MLHEIDVHFRGAFQYAAIGMALVAPDGRFLQVNRALCDLTGYAEEELLRRTFQDITHPDDLDADLALVRQMLAGEIPYYHLEKRYFDKLGRVLWIVLSVSLVRDGDGKPLYFISQIQDITRRKQVEAEREALIKQLQEAVATIKTLRGLLPICAWCKQIRTDTGYWEILEAFLQDHLDVAFTHCICPACYEKALGEQSSTSG